MAAYTVTAAQVTPGSACQWKWATAGETITAGMAVYVTEGGVAMKAKADETAAVATAVGVAIGSGAADQPIPYAVTGTIVIATGGAVGTTGDIVILGDTAGALYPSADIASGYTTIIGVLSDDAQSLHIGLFASGATYDL